MTVLAWVAGVAGGLGLGLALSRSDRWRLVAARQLALECRLRAEQLRHVDSLAAVHFEWFASVLTDALDRRGRPPARCMHCRVLLRDTDTHGMCADCLEERTG